MSHTFQGSRLRAAREAAGLTREAVAVIIGRSAYSIAEYETGRVVPPLSVLMTMSDVYGAPPSAFLVDEAAPAPAGAR